MKTAPCALGPKHTWVWHKDATLASAGGRPGMIKLARRGIYACSCGATKYGQPRSGL